MVVASSPRRPAKEPLTLQHEAEISRAPGEEREGFPPHKNPDPTHYERKASRVSRVPFSGCRWRRRVLGCFRALGILAHLQDFFQFPCNRSKERANCWSDRR